MPFARWLLLGLLAAALCIAAAPTFAANVTITPVPTNGRVTSNPGSINCGTGGTGVCTGSFANGSSLTLTAVPASASARFLQWTVTIGTSSGTSTVNPLTQNVPAVNTSVRADFGVVPGAPAMGGATAGNASATVTFKPPGSSGTSPITSYTVTSTPGGISASGAASPITISGLTNGTAYTFTVTAANAVGSGAASAASNSVTPFTTPGAPSNLRAVGASGQATLTFDPPASNGGAPILDYKATCVVVAVAPGVTRPVPDTATFTGSASPLLASPLGADVAYRCLVQARNAAGLGGPSNEVSAVTRPTPRFVTTDPPLAVVGQSYSHKFVLQGRLVGGLDISHLVTEPPPPNLVLDRSTGVLSGIPATRGTFVLKLYGTDYYYNYDGDRHDFTLRLVALPTAPQIGSATAGNASATVSFSPPVDDGGSPITGYRVTSSAGGGVNVTGTASPITVTGLANGTTYTFNVSAINAAGTGPSSAASNAVTPSGGVTTPGAPTNVRATAGNASATVSFTAPASDGGAPITSYTATSTPGSLSMTGSGSPLTVGGLSNGTSYTFTVRATNSAGMGPASTPSSPVTPQANPNAPPQTPQMRRIVPGDQRATIRFTPAAEGGSPTSFTATCNPGNRVASAGASPIVMTGLVNGQSHLCTVRAGNAAGSSGDSAPASVTPLASVFPLAVTSRIDAVSASASATFQVPAAAVGTRVNIYVFLLAPSSLVTRASSEAPKLVWLAGEEDDALDTSVACILAQVAGNGQLVGANIDALQATISNVVLGQTQAVTLLDNVPTPNVAGATTYMGFGQTSTSMIVNGTNRNAIAIPGSPACDPEPPETGLWRGASPSSTGFSIDVADGRMFFSAYSYDASGASTWYVSSGPVSIDGTVYQGTVSSIRNAQPPVAIGPITLAFSSATSGTLIWPPGLVSIERGDAGGIRLGNAPPFPGIAPAASFAGPGTGFMTLPDASLRPR